MGDLQAVLGVLMFVAIPAGAIAAIVLIAKAVARRLNGPQPSIDPPSDPPRWTLGDRIALLLIALGLVSLVVVYLIGSALAIR